MLNGTSDNGANPATAPAEPAKAETTAAVVTKADFEAWTSSFASKINGEQAALRKKLEGVRGDGKGETPPPAAATLDDVRASREVGKLEALLGDELVAALGEDYQNATPREQARLLRVAASIAEKTRAPAAETAGQSSRGETPVATPNARGMASQPRSPIPRPRTQAEFVELKRKDPKAAHELIVDPTFNLAALPPR